jgi:hypothetical protein
LETEPALRLAPVGSGFRLLLLGNKVDWLTSAVCANDASRASNGALGLSGTLFQDVNRRLALTLFENKYQLGQLCEVFFNNLLIIVAMFKLVSIEHVFEKCTGPGF